MLKYTGHPFIDVGVATIVAMADKGSPEEVTEEDLQNVTATMEKWFSSASKFRDFLSSIYPNSQFTQPAFNKPKYASKKAEYASTVLRSYQHAHSQGEELCAFCGDPAVYTASRAQVPLLNGQTIINFSPKGKPGLPVCGYCLLAAHALPFGTLKSEGRLLVVHTDDPEWTFLFARKGWHYNLPKLQMMDQGGITDWPNHSHPKTKLVHLLCKILSDAQRGQRRQPHPLRSLVAYHFTNYGPRPAISIYELPSAALSFIREAEHPGAACHEAWKYYIDRAWVQPKAQKGEEAEVESTEKEIGRNTLYEDLFSLPDTAGRFLARHLVPSARRVEAWLALPEGNWSLIELFFRKVMHMNTQRIEAIRLLGDRLAAYVQHRDRRLFNDLHFARNYGAIRLALIRAARDGWSPDSEALIPMDVFARVFEEGNDDLADLSWRLARDVLMIRMCEQLHQAGWFEHNRDMIESIQQAESEEETE